MPNSLRRPRTAAAKSRMEVIVISTVPPYGRNTSTLPFGSTIEKQPDGFIALLRLNGSSAQKSAGRIDPDAHAGPSGMRQHCFCGRTPAYGNDSGEGRVG